MLSSCPILLIDYCLIDLVDQAQGLLFQSLGHWRVEGSVFNCCPILLIDYCVINLVDQVQGLLGFQSLEHWGVEESVVNSFNLVVGQ